VKSTGRHRTLTGMDLEKSFGSRKIVDRISMTIEPGETVGLLGPNGAGKTTTFYMMAGIIRPDRGRILIGENDITRMDLASRARAGLSYLPQERSAFQGLTTEQNIMAVLEFQDITRDEQKELVHHLLREFSLEHLAGTRACALSGGEARRLEIARALAIQPEFLLMDEPFTGLDPLAVETIQGIVARLRRNSIGILISDHNVRETLKICDRAYILSQGKILESGPPARIAESQQVRAAYLGEDFRL